MGNEIMNNGKWKMKKSISTKQYLSKMKTNSLSNNLLARLTIVTSNLMTNTTPYLTLLSSRRNPLLFWPTWKFLANRREYKRLRWTWFWPTASNYWFNRHWIGLSIILNKKILLDVVCDHFTTTQSTIVNRHSSMGTREPIELPLSTWTRSWL